MDSGLDEPGGARVSSVSVKMRESGVFSVAGDISGEVDPDKSGEAGRGYQAEASADCLDMWVYKRVGAWSPRSLANGTTTRMVDWDGVRAPLLPPRPSRCGGGEITVWSEIGGADVCNCNWSSWARPVSPFLVINQCVHDHKSITRWFVSFFFF